jgi:hypothetical protein
VSRASISERGRVYDITVAFNLDGTPFRGRVHHLHTIRCAIAGELDGYLVLDHVGAILLVVWSIVDYVGSIRQDTTDLNVLTSGEAGGRNLDNSRRRNERPAHASET